MYTKVFAFLLAMMQLAFLNVTYGPWGASTGPLPPPEPPSHDISADSPLSPSVLYAAEVGNLPQGFYTDAARGQYAMRNADMVLTHDLRSGKRATLQSLSGGAYLEDTMDVFYTSGGKTYYAADSLKDARVNTIRLGLYYYEAHVRDLNFNKASGGAFWADKAYHLYGDRLYQELILFASQPTTALQSFGLEVKLPVDDVAAYEKNEAYAAFDIKGVGVVGFIFPADGSTGEVTLDTEGGNYVLRQMAAYPPGAPVRANDESGEGLYDVRFGNRIYTDRTHSFAGIQAAAEEERNPLTAADIAVTGGNANARFLGYEALRGSYSFAMDGSDFNRAYYSEPDVHFAAPLRFESPDDRDVYVRMNGSAGGLEAAAVLDGGGLLAPLPVEVCKNFQGDGGEPFYSIPDYQYGDSIFPLRLQGGEALDLTLLNLYQNWGKLPLKQISSIEFHTSYYHLSTGVTESNCIAPYFVYGRDGWTLPDFRGRSGVMWGGQPQFNSLGRLYFANYRRSLLKNYVSEYVDSRIDSAGPSYADITMTYRADCGSYDYTLRHMEFPQTDENRTYYTLDLVFNRDMTFHNARRDLELFSFDSRWKFLRFQQAGWLDKNNQPQAKATSFPWLSNAMEYIPLGDDCPYFGLFDLEARDDIEPSVGASFALIVKDSEITVGGEPWEGGLSFKLGTKPRGDGFLGILPFNLGNGDDINCAALTLDSERMQFKAGDRIKIDMILLPYGTGFETTDAGARAVREDSALNPLAIEAAVGSVVSDAWLPIVDSDGGLARFTLRGGNNNAAVRVNGFRRSACPTLEKWNAAAAAWETVDLASVNGYDGYTVFYNPVTGLYDFAFVVMTTGAEAEYRCGYAEDGLPG